ncbi:zinc finger protein 653 isoform X2 [Dipodomys merriami]|uniref:zinc finger protein 653 isoform X2 n=1 Tax=Dipodomys merriami TaxID=94247 RepID=UPI003855FD4E
MAERAPEPEAEAEAEAGAGGEAAAAEEGAAGRKARGRPRLTESDRARRRLESRKKYDVRRVYLGEAHGPWVDLRRRSGWSDAKLAAYLISLERGQRSGRHGKPWEQVPKKPKRKKRRRRNVNCLKNVVIWYEDHKHRCPYEPHLAELDPTFGLYTTAVWQCEAGHRYFQDLHSPLKPLSDSEPDSDKVGNGVGASSSPSSSSGSGSDSEDAPEAQPVRTAAVAAAVTPTSPVGSSGLITPDGVHIPFGVHHVESLAEQGAPLGPNPAGSGPEALETVVCVPVPVQVGAGPSTLFENVPQEALGEVVASCPVPGMVPGSQVIIIASPGYDALTAEGIHLNVAAGSGTPSGGLGEELPCAMMEGVAAYTQTEPEGSQPSTLDATAIASSIEAKKGGPVPAQEGEGGAGSPWAGGAGGHGARERRGRGGRGGAGRRRGHVSHHLRDPQGTGEAASEQARSRDGCGRPAGNVPLPLRGLQPGLRGPQQLPEPCQPCAPEREDQSVSSPWLRQEVLPIQSPAAAHDHPLRCA